MSGSGLTFALDEIENDLRTLSVAHLLADAPAPVGLGATLLGFAPKQRMVTCWASSSQP